MPKSKSFSRRDVLKASLKDNASLLTPQLTRRIQDGEKAHIIVVGAGVAGLAAANQLQQIGYRVTVLEARDRIGGRIWTNDALKGIPLDLGASWIHGIVGNPLSPLAAEADVEAIVTNINSYTVYIDEAHTRLNEEEMLEIDAIYESILAEVGEVAEALEVDQPLGDLLKQAVNRRGLSDRSRRLVDYNINSIIEQEYAADVNSLSAWWWEEYRVFDGEDVLFPQGYQWLPAKLAQGLTIELNAVIDSVTYDAEDGVTLVTQDGRTFDADAALLTIPVGVLKKGCITFHPPLPAPKQAAIEHLIMGTLNKVYMRFPSVFWDAESDWIDYVPLEKGQWSDFLNLSQVMDDAILMAFNAGEYGEAMEQLSDEQILSDAMKTLRAMYGPDIPDPTDWIITRWKSDPFAYGSYSANGVGASNEDREALAAPVDEVLFFAGEATHKTFFGSVHGALLTGWRAVQEIVEVI